MGGGGFLICLSVCTLTLIITFELYKIKKTTIYATSIHEINIKALLRSETKWRKMELVHNNNGHR